MAVEKVFAILVVAVRIGAIVNPHGPTVVSDFTNCISNLIEDNFQDPAVLIFASTNNVSSSVARIRMEVLKKINSKLKYAIEVLSPKGKAVNICDKYDEKLGIIHVASFKSIAFSEYFIIIVEKYEEFSYLISKLIKSHNWNPDAKFIILFFNYEYEIIIENVERMLSCFFKYNVINIAVIVPDANNIRNAIIYGWRPYDPPEQCGYFNETARGRLHLENRCEKGSLKISRGVFEDKIPTDMTGCILYIIALERQPFVSRDKTDANIEKVLIDELAGRYKFKTNYEIINSFRGERQSMGRWDGALGKLSHKKGHLLLGGIFPDFDVHEDFDCSIPYLADSYTWVVPRAYLSPPWVALVIIFQSLVWYSVVAGFSISALFWRILGQLSGDTLRNRSTDHCFLNAWICSLGFCSYIRPTTQSLRIFFVFFNIYCILVVTGYQTKLIDELKNPTFEYQIKTTEELVESGLKFGGFEELHGLFENSTDPFDKFLYDNWIDVYDMSAALVDVAVHRNFSVLCSRLELAHLSAVLPELSDHFGNYKYYAFELNMFSVPMEMIALRGFGFMSKFSKLLRLYKESGISDGVRRRYAAFNARRRGKLLQSLIQEKSDINSLSLLHLQGGFLILVLGYVGGIFVLVLEIISNTEYVRRKCAHIRTRHRS